MGTVKRKPFAHQEGACDDCGHAEFLHPCRKQGVPSRTKRSRFLDLGLLEIGVHFGCTCREYNDES